MANLNDVVDRFTPGVKGRAKGDDEMKFQLAKTLEGIKMYGPIFDLGTGGPDKVEEYVIDDVNDWFLDNMIDRINDVCGILLDDGDVDFIEAEKCKALIEMLNELTDDFIPKQFKEPINVLIEYAQRAIEYNTGIEIEM